MDESLFGVSTLPNGVVVVVGVGIIALVTLFFFSSLKLLGDKKRREGGWNDGMVWYEKEREREVRVVVNEVRGRRDRNTKGYLWRERDPDSYATDTSKWN